MRELKYPSPCKQKAAKTALKCKALYDINQHNRIAEGNYFRVWTKAHRGGIEFEELTNQINFN